MTFIGSPIPSHRISSGIRARLGIERLTCTGPSIRDSPIRDRPDAIASTVPMTTPSARPRPARTAEVAMLSWRRPSAIRSPAVDTTVHGALRVRSSSRPVAEPMNHSASRTRRADPEAERDPASRPKPGPHDPFVDRVGDERSIEDRGHEEASIVSAIAFS